MEGDNSLKKILFGKINRKITFLLLTVLFLIAIGGLLLFYLSSSKLLKDEFGAHLENIAHSNTNHVEHYLEEQKEKVEMMQESILIKYIMTTDKNAPDYIERYEIAKKRLDSLIFEEIDEFFVLDKNGILIVSSNEENIGSDRSDRNYFINGKERTYISDAYSSPTTKKDSLAFSAPMFDETGELLGVVVMRIETTEFDYYLTDRKGLGETGEVYLINKEGYAITPLRQLEEEDTFLKFKVDTENSRACLKQATWYEEQIAKKHTEAGLHIFPNYMGAKVIGTHVYIKEMGWCLLVEINEEEALGVQRNELIKIFLIILIVMLFFGAGLTGFISHSISKPITQLYQATEEVKKGNFKVRVNIQTGDELDQLGDNFNKTIKFLERIDEEHKQLEKAKTQFLSITSHELRSPMTPMKAQLQMLLGNYFGKLNAKQKGSLDIVLRNTERLDNIIKDFLEISRIEAARLKFHFVKVNLTNHVNRLIKEMQGFMPGKKIKIKTKIEDIPMVECDPDRVMQVLRNLINNAKKFSPKNSEIFIEIKTPNGRILFSVKDNGIGIKPEHQRRIFEPFFQVGQSIYREKGGSGLGLAIVKGIVESQNGQVWVKSEFGKGSTFFFTIPIKYIEEIKPIRLLFSEQENIEKKVLELFKEKLGPLGIEEFENLREKDQVQKENLIKYIKSIVVKGILDKKEGNSFKIKIIKIFKDIQKEKIKRKK